MLPALRLIDHEGFIDIGHRHHMCTEAESLRLLTAGGTYCRVRFAALEHAHLYCQPYFTYT